MSWDVSLTDRVTGEVLHSDSPHMMRGGTTSKQRGNNQTASS